jgi:hypothetical protein
LCATLYKGIILGAFLDIEGAFERTSCDITQASERHDIYRWISSMRESIITTFSGETMKVSVVGGCLQGGALLPLLWSLVVNELFWELSDNDDYAVRYADVIAVLIDTNSFRLCQGSYK